MICNKGNYIFNIAYEREIRKQRNRIKQLEDVLKSKGIEIPNKPIDDFFDGYNMDSEE